MDEVTLELANLMRSECKNVIEKISYLKQYNKEELLDHFLPTQIYFNEIVNNIIEQCKIGPSSAKVTRIKIENFQKEFNKKSFDILNSS